MVVGSGVVAAQEFALLPLFTLLPFVAAAAALMLKIPAQICFFLFIDKLLLSLLAPLLFNLITLLLCFHVFLLLLLPC